MKTPNDLYSPRLPIGTRNMTDMFSRTVNLEEYTQETELLTFAMGQFTKAKAHLKKVEDDIAYAENIYQQRRD